jgi:hypothetical protein
MRSWTFVSSALEVRVFCPRIGVLKLQPLTGIITEINNSRSAAGWKIAP